MTIVKHHQKSDRYLTRFWAVYWDGEVFAVVAYRKGAIAFADIFKEEFELINTRDLGRSDEYCEGQAVVAADHLLKKRRDNLIFSINWLAAVVGCPKCCGFLWMSLMASLWKKTPRSVSARLHRPFSCSRRSNRGPVTIAGSPPSGRLEQERKEP